ncbi:MAG: MarC family protein [Candidatus Cyclobacteriaceae bacterium M3_2C_046]
MNWNLYLNFLAAVFAIINPVGIWPIWSELTKDTRNNKTRTQIALMVVFTSFFILLVFLITGKYVLQFFSIDLQVFKIAGGILILNAGIAMVQGSATQLTDREEQGETPFALAKQRFRKIIVPLAIPALAGPGSITTVILFGSKTSSWLDYGIFAIILLLAFFVLLVLFARSNYLEKNVDNIVFTIFTRVFGIMVTAIAIQFMAEGLGEVFPNWLEGVSELEK